MSVPQFWQLRVNGALLPKQYTQRSAARGAAMILRAQGHSVDVISGGNQ